MQMFSAQRVLFLVEMYIFWFSSSFIHIPVICHMSGCRLGNHYAPQIKIFLSFFNSQSYPKCNAYLQSSLNKFATFQTKGIKSKTTEPIITFIISPLRTKKKGLALLSHYPILGEITGHKPRSKLRKMPASLEF